MKLYQITGHSLWVDGYLRSAYKEMTLTEEQYKEFEGLSKEEQLEWLEEEGELEVSDFRVNDYEDTSSFDVYENEQSPAKETDLEKSFVDAIEELQYQKLDSIFAGEEKEVDLINLKIDDVIDYAEEKGITFDIGNIDTNGWQVDYWLKDNSGIYSLSGSLWYNSMTLERQDD